MLHMIFLDENDALSTYKPLVQGRQWAISTRDPLATQAGVRMFEQGGNAIDATVAALAVLGLVEPTSSGIGGEAFFLIYDPEAPQKVVSINGGGTAPRHASIDWYHSQGFEYIPSTGLLSSVVPGVIDAWMAALDKYGKLSVEQVLSPAIELASNGFPASDRYCSGIRNAEEELKKYPSSTKLYLKPDGSFYKPNDIIYNHDMAYTLQTMVKASKSADPSNRSAQIQAARDVFYRGSLAVIMSDFCKENGGLIDLPSLQAYAALVETPVRTTFRGLDIYKSPSNNQGPAELFILRILDGFPLEEYTHNSAEAIHLLAEAVNIAMADREKFLGDQNFVSIPYEGLLSEEYIQQRRALIRFDRILRTYAPGDPFPFQKSSIHYDGKPFYAFENPEALPTTLPEIDRDKYTASLKNPSEKYGLTSYVCAADAQGNAVSCTPSNFSSFGSKVVIEGLGFPVNNRCTYFHLEDPNHANSLAPGKRPRNTITPSFAMQDGKPFLVYGTPGGDQQTQALMQTLINLVVYDMNIQEAIDAPMFRSYSFPLSFNPHETSIGHIRIDDRIPEDVIYLLRSKGWTVEMVSEFGNNSACGIQIDFDNHIFQAAAISKKRNHAMAW